MRARPWMRAPVPHRRSVQNARRPFGPATAGGGRRNGLMDLPARGPPREIRRIAHASPHAHRETATHGSESEFRCVSGWARAAEGMSAGGAIGWPLQRALHARIERVTRSRMQTFECAIARIPRAQDRVGHREVRTATGAAQRWEAAIAPAAGPPRRRKLRPFDPDNLHVRQAGAPAPIWRDFRRRPRLRRPWLARPSAPGDRILPRRPARRQSAHQQHACHAGAPGPSAVELARVSAKIYPGAGRQ